MAAHDTSRTRVLHRLRARVFEGLEKVSALRPRTEDPAVGGVMVTTEYCRTRVIRIQEWRTLLDLTDGAKVQSVGNAVAKSSLT